MINLRYSLIIEATADLEFFGFFSPDLEGSSGVGHSIEDCIHQARWGMEDHLRMLRVQGFLIPSATLHPTILVQNEIGPALRAECGVPSSPEMIDRERYSY